MYYNTLHIRKKIRRLSIARAYFDGNSSRWRRNYAAPITEYVAQVGNNNAFYLAGPVTSHASYVTEMRSGNNKGPRKMATNLAH